MNDWLVIVIIAVIAAGLSVAVWFIRIKRDERKQRERMHRRRVEDAERAERMGEAWQNVIKKPKDGIDWERRYAELVEDVSRRTDQAKGMK